MQITSSTARRTAVAAAAAALTVTGLAALPAQAADGTKVTSTAGGLSVVARAGIANAIAVSLTDSTFSITDRDLVIAGNGCVPIARNIAQCDVLGDDVSISSGDLDDTVSAPVALKVTVNGGDGADTLTTGAGRDVLTGGNGADRLFGGGNDDRFVSGAGADEFNGGAGTDLVEYSGTGGTGGTGVNVSIDDVANDGTAGEGDNVRTDVEELRGTSGDDVLTGSNLAGVTNRLLGGNGKDTLKGLAGTDRLFGQDGNDTIDGGDGNDDLDGGAGADDLRGGAGAFDEVSYSGRTARVIVDMANEQADDGESAIDEQDNVHGDVEDLVGTEFDDRVTGNGSANTISTGGGGDVIFAGGGDDTVFGGDGPDSMSGELGDDSLNGGESDDNLIGGPGADDLFGGSGDDEVFYSERTAAQPVVASIDDVDNDGAVGEHDDIDTTVEDITGGNGSDTLTGSAFSNDLDGGPGFGNDVLNGLGGDDRLDGFFGADTLNCGAGVDVATGGPLGDLGASQTECETVFEVP